MRVRHLISELPIPCVIYGEHAVMPICNFTVLTQICVLAPIVNWIKPESVGLALLYPRDPDVHPSLFT